MYTILLVDDEPILLRAAMGFLGKYEDFMCDTCASGAEALERIRAASYDVVVSDYEMPGMSGIDLLKAIRERRPDLPFILFTGRGREEVAIEALNHGADFYVQKGGDIEAQFADLAHKIRHAAEKTRSTVRLRHLNQALVEEKERLKVTLRSIGDGVIVTDTKGRVVSLNPVAEELCGWTSDEAAGRPLNEVFCIINEKTGTACANPVEKVLKSGRIVGLANHTALISRNGTKRAIADSAAPIRDAGGVILGVVLVFRDVTAEKEAEREHLWLAAIAGSSDDAIYTVTPEGIITTWNWGAERIYGYPATEVIGQHASAVAPPELAGESTELMERVKDGDLVEQYETYRYRKGGERIDITLTVSPLIDADGEFLGFSGISRDITERKRHEQRIVHLNQTLTEEKERLRVTLHSIGDGVIVTDTEGRVVSLNPVGEELCGWTSDEAAGRPLTDVFHIINEKTRRVCTNPVEKVLESGRIVGLANHTALISRNSEERVIADSAAPIRDAGGAILGVVLVFSDVTKEKRAEMERLRLTAIAESSENAIFNAAPDGTILGWNPGAERMTGYAADEIIGSHISVLAPPDRKTESLENIKRVQREGRVLQIETVRARKDGSLIDISATILPILDEDGDFIGFSGIIRDITEKKEAEKRIAHINRVLLAIRNVNQLITQVRDEETLLREVCNTLIETRGFYSAWIALFDEAGNCTRAVEAGVGDNFVPMAEHLFRGELTKCGRRALETPAVIVTRDPAAACGDCPIASHYRGRAAMARRLEGNDRVYGLLSISVPGEMADDEEEQALFEEVASDIGFALHNYEIEQDRVRAEKALFEANTKLNLLSSITRHDIINQTNGISAMMHLLSEELGGNPTAQEYCAYMQGAIDTINRQIFFTRDYQDMGVSQPEWHRVAAVIEHAAKTTITNGISLDSQTGPLEIYADPMVERVFFNLLDNAVRHGGEVGTIRVTSATRNGQCTIIVEDDGGGIPASNKEAIFERGFGKNTGYGLFLARAILDITGISIRETGEEGKGARFEIALPPETWRQIPE